MTVPTSSAHPAARALGRHLIGTLRAVGPLAALVSGPHRSVAMATLAVRGAEGRSQEMFAVAYGIDLRWLLALENGETPRDEIPAPLLVLTPIVHVLDALASPQEDAVA